MPSSDVRRGRQEKGEAEVTNEVGGGTGVIGTVRSFSDLQPTGDFSYSFETENGIKQEAYGESRSIGEAEVIVMRGSYEFIGDDGLTYVVEWEADEKGFRASAPHLPKPVEIPFAEQVSQIFFSFRLKLHDNPSPSTGGSRGGSSAFRRTRG